MKKENRGGVRKGAGRPLGSTKPTTKLLSLRIREELVLFFKAKLGKEWLIEKIEEEYKKEN